MYAYVLSRDGLILCGRNCRHIEVCRHERPQIEIARFARRSISLEHLCRRAFGHGVHERLTVGEDALHLHLNEQLSIQLRRREDLRGTIVGIGDETGRPEEKNDAEDALNEWHGGARAIT